MGKYLGPKCKLNRRLGVDLQLKGRNSNGGTKKKTPPGGYSKKRARQLSDYGKQLRAKQVIKRLYNLLEKQFKLTFKRAERKPGKTGDNLLILLETRLDNVVYISHLGVSRNQARQMINHKHVKVNGIKVNIPSYELKPGDVVEVIDKFKKHRTVLESLKNASNAPLPKWINLDVDNAKVEVLSLPERSDITIPVEEHLVVELYSK
jgi:small subunit ribosomal protein S4